MSDNLDPTNQPTEKGFFGKAVDSGREFANKLMNNAKDKTSAAFDQAKAKAEEKSVELKEKASDKASSMKESITEQTKAKTDELKQKLADKIAPKQTQDNTQAQQTESTPTSVETSAPKKRIAINGFGRIGRQFARIAIEKNLFDIVAINNPGEPDILAHLFEFDSTYGRFPGTVELKDNQLIVNGKPIRLLGEKDPAALPWKEMNIDVVVDSTGVFLTREALQAHLSAGAKKVVLSAPAKSKGDITHVIMGVNDKKADLKTETIFSMASCTTNCLAPALKVISENFGIEKGDMLTVHSYTNDQRILDLPHSDPRRARAANLSMIPTTTGATKAAALVLPELKDKMTGYSLRVPTPTVSLVNFSATLSKSTTKEEINAAFEKAATGELKGILGVEPRPLVSVDFRGDSRSSIIDTALTECSGNFARFVAWYDNEWGYSTRLAEFTALISQNI